MIISHWLGHIPSISPEPSVEQTLTKWINEDGRPNWEPLESPTAQYESIC